MNHVDRFLRDRIECGHGFGVRLKRALRHDQVRELGGNIHIRSFQRAPLDRSAPAASRHADRCIA